MKKEELLSWLDQAHRYFTFEPPGKDEQAYKEIVALIKKEVTEEWIEEKAKIVTALFYRLTQHEPYLGNHRINLEQAKDFIRSLFEEIKK